MKRPVKWSGSRSVVATEREQWAYGSFYLLCTVSVPCATPSFGKPHSYLTSEIGLSANTVVLPNYIERFHNTLRQGVGRLVPPSLSFSKKLSNHLGAIGDLIHYYHATLTP